MMFRRRRKPAAAPEISWSNPIPAGVPAAVADDFRALRALKGASFIGPASSLTLPSGLKVTSDVAQELLEDS